MIDTALSVIRRHGLTFLRLTAVPTIVCVAALVFVLGYTIPSLTETNDPNSTIVQLEEAIFAISLTLFVGAPVFLLGSIYGFTVVARLASNAVLGRTVDPQEAEVYARANMLRLFAAGLFEMFVCLSGELVGGALMLIAGALTRFTPDSSGTSGIVMLVGILTMFGGLVVSAYILIRRTLVLPVAVIEEVGVRRAAKRCSGLMKRVGFHSDGGGTATAIYVLMAIVSVVVGLGLTIVIGIVGLSDLIKQLSDSTAIQTLLSTFCDLVPVFFVLWLLIPFWATTVVVLYYERRVRIEGFDIEQLAEEIGRDGRTSRFDV